MNICSMIEKGDVFSNVEGRTVEEVYNNICKEKDTKIISLHFFLCG